MMPSIQEVLCWMPAWRCDYLHCGEKRGRGFLHQPLHLHLHLHRQRFGSVEYDLLLLRS